MSVTIIETDAVAPNETVEFPVSSAEIMTVEECALFARTSVSYWRKKIAANALPVLRLGTRTLLRKSDVLEYLASKVSPSSSELSDRARSIAATMRIRKGAV